MVERKRSELILLDSSETKPTEYWVEDGFFALEQDTGKRFQYQSGAWVDISPLKISNVITATTTVSNTVTETTIYTGEIAADSLEVGQVVTYDVRGVISNASAADDITVNVYIGSTLVEAFNPAIGNVTSAVWDVDGEFTVRSLGASGSIAYEGRAYINGNVERVASIETIDTTVAEDLTVKVQWDNAKAGNTISVYQALKETKN